MIFGLVHLLNDLQSGSKIYSIDLNIFYFQSMKSSRIFHVGQNFRLEQPYGYFLYVYLRFLYFLLTDRRLFKNFIKYKSTF